MITRPLDLAARLRPEPRNFDWLFFVNAGLLVLFFSLFGSRFVLAPGIAMLPAVAGADENARRTTHYITVHNERQIYAGDGLRDLESLNAWLVQQAKTHQHPVLLVQSNTEVDLGLTGKIFSLARDAGFEVQLAAVEPAKRGAPPRR